jgi:pimeloyl-ACP methyl ester carboxylesterase
VERRLPVTTTTERSDAKPTIVLVHGAFADGSSWNGVIERLLPGGYTVIAPANGLRGVIADSAYLGSVIEQIDGPVLLVGHSYGGALISNAGTNHPNVVGLVFVAAYATDDGETLSEASADSKDSVLNEALVQQKYTGENGEMGVELAINPSRFRDAFAADLPESQTRLMSATQRPIASVAFGDRSGPPAWKSLPSWAVVATGDKAAGTDVIRRMVTRAGADIVEVDSSHVVMISHPQEVADVILKAARSVVSRG